MRKLWLSWSSGKDSAYSLAAILNGSEYSEFKVTGIFTSINQEFGRVAMHSTREELLELQAERLGLPVYKIYLPYPCNNNDYERIMTEFITVAKDNNVSAMAFGDLFLEDVRNYRIGNMRETGIEPIFPIWGMNTQSLSENIIDSGYKAVLTCIDTNKLPDSFAGQLYDKNFLRTLPVNIDPCGENGEFHSFVYDCPLFSKPIAIKTGEQRRHDNFLFTDIIDQIHNKLI